MKTTTQIQLHRFNGHAAISFLGNNHGTAYVTAELVRELIDNLDELAHDLETQSDSGSYFESVTIGK